MQPFHTEMLNKTKLVFCLSAHLTTSCSVGQTCNDSNIYTNFSTSFHRIGQSVPCECNWVNNTEQREKIYWIPLVANPEKTLLQQQLSPHTLFSNWAPPVTLNAGCNPLCHDQSGSQLTTSSTAMTHNYNPFNLPRNYGKDWASTNDIPGHTNWHFQL